MIFNLFKSKPTLKEIIPNGFVDIHSHILPGIDDGPKDLAESLELISKIKKMGFSKIIGTPHTYSGLYNNTNRSIANSFNEIKANLKTEIEITYASEYMLDEIIFQKAKEKKLLCLKDKYVLVEMSYISPPYNLYEILYEIKINGYKPILAHPERYLFYRNNFKNFFKLKKIGCYFQSNLLSATNYYGREVSSILDRLLMEKLIDFAGSDIHNIKHIESFDKKLVIKNVKLMKGVMEKNNLFN